MDNHSLRTSRRARAALVALGIAGSVGAAGAIGLATGVGTANSPDSGTAPAKHSRVSARVTSDDEDGEDGGASRPVRRQAPAPAPQPASGGSTHATTSGS